MMEKYENCFVKEKTMASNEKYWNCFVEGTVGGFHHFHPTFDSAKQEAERLARLPQNSERKVFILEAVGYYEVPEIPVVYYPM